MCKLSCCFDTMDWRRVREARFSKIPSDTGKKKGTLFSRYKISSSTLLSKGPRRCDT